MSGLSLDEVRRSLLDRGVSADVAFQYAEHFVEYVNAVRNITEYGSVVQHPRTGNPIPNPLLPIRDAALRKLKRFRGLRLIPLGKPLLAVPRKVPTHRTTPRLPAVSQREYDQTRRDGESKRFYNSAAWRKVRKLKLAESPLCEVCRKAGRFTPASHIHHKVELRDEPSLALEVDNLQSLCHACHSRHHAAQ